jgi:pseudouridine-5'-phosphate glycosidase/sugar/nucleoside kinase (ribokinase family)
MHGYFGMDDQLNVCAYSFLHTTAIKNGQCRVGLTDDELHDLALAGEQGRAEKCSTRELSLFLARQYSGTTTDTTTCTTHTTTNTATTQWGATTVASTMRLAHMAGIATFVTGGIGGVHRHGHVTMDVSADVLELSRTPVVVVSAGIKSILDIPRTLQVLETYSVPVVSYQTSEFPAFFSPHSGVASPCRMDSVAEIAMAYNMAQNLGLSHGMLVAVKPSTESACSGENVERAIQSALAAAESQGITGQAVTPFVLQRVAQETGGDSLQSNMALVLHNAEIGADIAIAIVEQQSCRDSLHHLSMGHIFESTDCKEVVAARDLPSQVIVMGGAVLDIIAKPAPGHTLLLGTSNPAICTESDGGVGRNIAEVLGRLGSRPVLYSAVGSDARGRVLVERLTTACGVLVEQPPPPLSHAHHHHDGSGDVSTIATVPHAGTATYVAVLNEEGDLHTACADMDVLQHIAAPPPHVWEHASMLVLDANPPVSVLRQAAMAAVQAGATVFLDPTSVAKACMVAKEQSLLACLTYLSPNLDELAAMAGMDDLAVQGNIPDNELVRRAAHELLRQLNPSGAHLIITCGPHGVLLASSKRNGPDTFQQFAAPTGMPIANATGAGDSLSGAVVHALLNGKSVPHAIAFGMQAAALSLQCADAAISPELSKLVLPH